MRADPRWDGMSMEELVEETHLPSSWRHRAPRRGLLEQILGRLEARERFRVVADFIERGLASPSLAPDHAAVVRSVLAHPELEPSVGYFDEVPAVDDLIWAATFAGRSLSFAGDAGESIRWAFLAVDSAVGARVVLADPEGWIRMSRLYEAAQAMNPDTPVGTEWADHTTPVRTALWREFLLNITAIACR